MKYSIVGIIACAGTIAAVNLYKIKYSSFDIDLNNLLQDEDVFLKKQNIHRKITDQVTQTKEIDPFEACRHFNFDQYLTDRLTVALYNPPLTNRLFPKSNLYGHELIRYFDL